jgi:hypothetical protein
MHLPVVVLAVLLFQGPCVALLEETIVSSRPAPAAIDITSAPIICSEDDFKGVHIAVDSLSQDLAEITSRARDVHRLDVNTLRGELDIDIAIIAGSINSTLIQALDCQGIFNSSEIKGKWESFSTEVVQGPLPGVRKALVIAGSDKRGTIFGIHTVAEQCGQSP